MLERSGTLPTYLYCSSVLFAAKVSWVVFFLATVVGAGAWQFKAEEAPDLDGLFQLRPVGWLGADVSSSFHMGNSLYMWLWGDTLLGKLALHPQHPTVERQWSVMPHSSLAWMNMSESLEVKFWWRLLPNGQVDTQGLFTPQHPTIAGEYYWTINGMIGPKTGYLFVVAMAIYDPTPTTFQQVGTDIIVITNPFEHPERWNYKTSRIPSSNSNISWNTAVTYFGGSYYFVGLNGGHGAILSRITEEALARFDWNSMQFLTTGLRWSSVASPLAVLFPSPFTEGSLQWHPHLKQWFMILSQAFDNNIYIATSAKLEGPWTKQAIYTVPPPFNGALFINYGAKSHPELATFSNEIVLTYNCNAINVSTLTEALYAYHPVFVRVWIH
jgi:hypothetical protein